MYRTHMPPILREPRRMDVSPWTHGNNPTPVAAEDGLLHLWYAVGLRSLLRDAAVGCACREIHRTAHAQVRAARDLNAARRQLLLELWRSVAGLENVEGFLMRQLGLL